MLQGWVIASVSFAYLGVLFAIAYFGDKRADAGRSVIANPTIYALSLAVYCTTWTFYGSVGRAASTGIGFLPIYLGPTLMAGLSADPGPGRAPGRTRAQAGARTAGRCVGPLGRPGARLRAGAEWCACHGAASNSAASPSSRATGGCCRCRPQGRPSGCCQPGRKPRTNRYTAPPKCRAGS